MVNTCAPGAASGVTFRKEWVTSSRSRSAHQGSAVCSHRTRTAVRKVGSRARRTRVAAGTAKGNSPTESLT